MSDERDDPFGRRDEPASPFGDRPEEPVHGDWLPPVQPRPEPAAPAWAPPAGASSEPAPPSGFTAGPVHQGKTPGKATAALILGIVGLLICPFVCSVLAIVFGLQARNEIRKDPSLGGEGTAQAGWILGVVGLVAGVVVAILYGSGVIEGL